MIMEQVILDVKDLSVYYGKVQALHRVNMHVDNGELVVVVGSNGAGKSTLMKTIAGLQKPAVGSIDYKGSRISGRPPHFTARQGISLVPEGRMIFGDQTVRENLVLGAHWSRQRVGKERLQKDIETCYERFPILRDREFQLAGTLSGGEQQMLALSRGLMSKPALLMIDEPSLGLAPLVIRQVFNTISTLKEEGLTILLVEQMARVALEIAERGYVIENGAIVMKGLGIDLLKDEYIIESYLGRE
jgi:branched-chain amino acid transport system ATP-binding protein